tara:strand:+ start:556 stop:2595 length:2040 start_codon:yes stop_codon:yes gene_type:complete
MSLIFMKFKKSLLLYFRSWVLVGVIATLLNLSKSDLEASDSEKYDLVIYGATPGGVACAVRAAREGLSVCLVSPYENLGGMLSNGLSTMDTLYHGFRAPIYDELRQNIYDYYRNQYGEESEQYRRTQPGHPKTRYEAHIVEKLINLLIDDEKDIKVLKSYYPVEVEQSSRRIRKIKLKHRNSQNTLDLSGEVFADCSYEADLVAAAGVPYRVGREAKEEFIEAHAGIIYLRRVEWPTNPEDKQAWNIARSLNLYRYNEWFEVIAEASTGEAHPSVQGYNMRTVITSNPQNRIPIERPKDYDPEPWLKFGFGNPDRPGLSMPNNKFGMNEPKLVGQQNRYVEGDWEVRDRVKELHVKATLSLLYFRQNDPSVPIELRKAWLEYGLPKDEFTDNDHIPYEIYARETRRIRGRAVFTENDASLAVGLERAPIHSDSISITEWFMDSHACTPRSLEGSEMEGKVMMKNETFPGQLSYKTLFPEGLDNFIVPGALSASHVGWGTIRLEPTWMSIGEAAAYALVIAKEEGVNPDEIDTEKLLRLLAKQRVLISFFNDIEGEEGAEWYPAVQYLGTKGFFSDYNARPNYPLSTSVASVWIDLAARLMQDSTLDTTSSARKVLVAEKSPGQEIVTGDFIRRLEEVLTEKNRSQFNVTSLLNKETIKSDEILFRGDACRLIFNLTEKR